LPGALVHVGSRSRILGHAAHDHHPRPPG
jgi:hypothetical protein